MQFACITIFYPVTSNRACNNNFDGLFSNCICLYLSNKTLVYDDQNLECFDELYGSQSIGINYLANTSQNVSLNPLRFTYTLYFDQLILVKFNLETKMTMVKFTKINCNTIKETVKMKLNSICPVSNIKVNIINTNTCDLKLFQTISMYKIKYVSLHSFDTHKHTNITNLPKIAINVICKNTCDLPLLRIISESNINLINLQIFDIHVSTNKI